MLLEELCLSQDRRAPTPVELRDGTDQEHVARLRERSSRRNQLLTVPGRNGTRTSLTVDTAEAIRGQCGPRAARKEPDLLTSVAPRQHRASYARVGTGCRRCRPVT